MRNSIFWLALILISLNLRPALTSIAPVMEVIVNDLSVSRANAELIMTIPVLLMGLLAPLSPLLARKFGQELILTATMAVLVIAFTLRFFSQSNFNLLLLSSFFTGCAIAIAGPLMSGFIKQHFSKNIGVAVALYSVCISLGASIAVAMTIPIIDYTGGGWEIGLSAWGFIALVTFFILILFLPKTKDKQALTSNHRKLPLHSFKAWLLTLFFSAQAGIFYAFSTWIVAHYEQVGFTNTYSSVLASAFMASGMIGALVIPIVASKLLNRRKLIVAVTMNSTLLILGIAWFPNLYPIFVVSALGICTSGTFALALALPVLESESPHKASQLSSMMSLFGYLLGGLTPSFIGISRDFTGDFSWPFTLLSVLSGCMVIIAFLLPNSPPKK